MLASHSGRGVRLQLPCRHARGSLALPSRSLRAGDGGNVEGLSRQFIDAPPQPDYCANTSLYDVPPFQPIDRPEPVITLQDGLFCPTSQPAWSAFREQSFGYGAPQSMLLWGHAAPSVHASGRP